MRIGSKPSLFAVLVFPILALTAAGPARAQKKGGGTPRATIERARTEIGELRYEDAQKTVEKAIRSGTNGPGDMAELYLLMGEVKASLGDDEAAQSAFKSALSIDPAAELRDGLSPKIREPFGKAKKAMKGKKPLAIQHRILKPDPPTIAVLVESDPMGMIIGGRRIYKNAEGAERSVAGMGKERVDLKLPRGTSKFTVAGIDEHGNRLILLGSESEPLTLDIESGGGGGESAGGAEESGGGESAGGEEDGGGGEEATSTVSKSSDDSGGPPFYAHWMVWGGAAVAIAGVGVVTGLSTRSSVNKLDDVRQNSEMYEYTYAQSLADKAERRALYTNIAFGAAAACAVVSGVLFWRQRRAGRAEREAALVPMLGGESAGVAAHLRF